jgi:hypothetical protein
MTKNHTDVINAIIKRMGAKSYLEIGVFNTDHNFDKIECDYKIGVDPDPTAKATFALTSDDFFDAWEGRLFDVIFIDGLHHADQVEKDFRNAMKILSDKGFIVLHDTNPHSERITHVPRDNGEWCGDVYKFAANLHAFADINFFTVDFDYGVTVAWADISKKEGVHFSDVVLDYEFFNKVRKEALNLITVEEFEKWAANEVEGPKILG